MALSSKKPNKVLILALSGIGNFLMQRPFIQALKAQVPTSDLTVWVAPRGVRPLAEITPEIDSVIEKRLPKGVARLLWRGWRLNRRSFDHTVMLSPGQLWKGAFLMTLSGAHERFGHRYPHLGNPSSPFLLTESVPEEQGVHDIEQNLQLLRLFDIDPAPYLNKPYHLELPETFRQQGAKLIPREAEGKKLIAFHPGASQGFVWKHWPLEHFAELGQMLQKQHNTHIVILGGAAEWKQQQQLQKQIGQGASVVSSDLLTIAGLISHCNLMIANDSGLMHLAAALGVRTYGLFGPTDEKLTGPRGVNSHALRAPDTKPTYSTEAGDALGDTPAESLQKLTPTYVLVQLRIKI